MPPLEINDFHRFGVIKDRKPYMLPPEAFSLGENVRFEDGDVRRMPGWEQIFGAPLVPPYFAMPVATPAQTFWLYMGLAKGNVYDGTNHTDITRAVGGNYAASQASDFNGTVLGGIPIINNGVDIPQFWASPTIATKLANLTNWPATHRAKVIRALGSFVLAANITVSGAARPHRLLWSHPADPGTIPSSWDVTDATKDAGEKELPDTESGVIVEMRSLLNQMYIYKEASTWRARFVGGQEIFDVQTFSETTGALAPRCVTTGSDGRSHVVVTQDDIIRHSGGEPQSIIDERHRSTLFNEIDTNNYQTSFLFTNPAKKEVWFCYPGAGQSVPTRVLVINERYGSITEGDIDFQYATVGAVETVSDEGWEDTEETWDEDTGPWSEVLRRKVILVNPVANKFLMLDKGLTRDGAAFTATVQREGLSVLGQKRNGEWIVDHQSYKLLSRLWPKIRGGPVEVRTGVQSVVDGPVTWGPYKTFNPALEVFVDANLASGRANAYEIRTTANVDWQMDGLKAEVAQESEF